MEDADVFDVSVKHFQRQHEVFPLVRVGDEQSLGGAVMLQTGHKYIKYGCLVACQVAVLVRRLWSKHAI